jgi:hypothetical protein
MFTRFGDRHRLTNLIWVLGWAGQNVDPRYYPGRSMVDVAGADIYASDHGNLAPMFAAVKRIVGETVPICLHENGPIPDPAPDTLRAAYRAERYLTLDEIARRR